MIKCDPRAKVRCPFKNPCCGDETAYFVEGSECDKFNREILAPPPTNADRIRNMSDEELARWLVYVRADVRTTRYASIGEPAVRANIEWLQQPAEDIGDGT